MAAARQISTITRCTRCQRHALNGFLSLAGLSLQPLPPPIRSPFRRPFQSKYYTNTSKSFSSTSRTQDEESVRSVPESEVYSVERSDYGSEPSMQLSEEEFDAGETGTEGTPWYLEEDENIVPEITLAERQRLPDLPENSPAKLPEILERLSVDIGLDYLRIIDLRELDPPPALGAGVMMLIGTARSEKHLHVSADRFARWLRSHYKLTPNADGLLGRNELKLKLKRKAKRAKLLGSVGASPKVDEDDGTKTGWICIDAGVIEHTPAKERTLDDSGIIGFGGAIDGVKLVVQMMTEEKRRELDLETLWERTMARHARRLAGLEELEDDPSIIYPRDASTSKAQSNAVASTIPETASA